MTIQIVWDDDEKTILHHIYKGRWTWEEMREVDVQVKQMLGEVSHPVHMIIDMSHSFFLPNGPTIGNLRNAEQNLPPNARSIILVGNNLLTMLISRVMRLIPATANRRFYVATSLEDAREIIRRIPRSANSD